MAGDNTQKEILAPPRMTILSDHPILRHEDQTKEPDSFTLPSRLAAVYDIIRHKNTRPPLAVAIYGDWGTGKSSAMRWLEDALKRWSRQEKAERKGHADIRTVWFDPWKYTRREDVWRGLISEVILRSLPRDGTPIERVLHAVRNFGHSLGRAFLDSLSSIELTTGVEAGGHGVTAKTEVSANLEAFSKVLDDYRERSRPEKAYLNEFETALREWVKVQLGEEDRMVVFIDDLDRCLPGVVLEVLEALKLYLNIPQLIFVVGLDRDVVESVVEKHYEEQGLGKAKAKHYLDKMFQVEIDIPPSQRLMAGYIAGQIAAMDAASEHYWSESLDGWKKEYKTLIEEKITDLAAHNPREVKRLLNSMIMRATAAARDEKLGGMGPERFTQGCQVYLIHCYLKKYVPNSGGLLREDRILGFLKEWSDFVVAYPDYQRPGRRLGGEGRNMLGEEGTRDTESPRSPLEERGREADPEAEAKYKGLREAVPRYRDAEFGGQAIPLLAQADVEQLLTMPFSVNVATAAIIEGEDGDGKSDEPGRGGKPGDRDKGRASEATSQAFREGRSRKDRKRARASGASESLASMPAFVRSKIAQSLKKSVDSLSSEDLSSVRELDLSFSDIKDVSWLSGLTALQNLYLGGTQVGDVAPLSGLTALQDLSLARTPVHDVSPLSGLTALQELNLARTRVKDVSSLSGLTLLHKLDLDGTSVADMTSLVASGLPGLHWLSLSGTPVTDISPLSGLIALKTLSLSDTRVTDVSPLSGLIVLEKLSLARTPVTDVSPLSPLTALSWLSLSGTQITDLSPLSGLMSLKTLYLIGCQGITDAVLRSLDGCKQLTDLRTGGTQVTKAAKERFLGTRRPG